MVVESLEVQLQANAQSACTALDGMIQKLDDVADKLSTIGLNKGLDDFMKEVQKSTKGLSGIRNAVKDSFSDIEPQMQKVSKNISEVAKEFQEKFKDIPVKVDFSKPESEMKKFQSQAENAQNAITRIMASSNANKQIKGLEKWSIVLAQANNAVEQLQSKAAEKTKLNVEVDEEKIKNTDALIEQMKAHIQQLQNSSGIIKNPVNLAMLTDEQFELFRKLEEEAAESENEVIQHLRSAGAFKELQEYIEKMRESTQQATESARECIETWKEAKLPDFGGEKIEVKGIEEAEQRISSFSAEIQNVWADAFSGLRDAENWHQLTDGVKEYVKNIQTASGIRVYTEDYKNILVDIERVEGILENLEQKQRDLQASGMISRESREWQNVANKIAIAESQLEKYTAGKYRMEAMGSDTEFSGGLADQSWIKSTLAVADEAMSSLRQRIAEIGSAVSQAIGNIPIIGRAAKEVAFMGEAAFNGLKSAISSVASIARKTANIISTIASAFKKLASGIKNVISKFSGLTKASGGMNTSFLGGLTTLLKYSLGIRTLYTLFNKLRSAIKDGFENLTQYDDKTNQSLSMLKSSLNQLKNSLAAAFAPILNAIAPTLNYLIQLLIKATNAVNQFLSALLGGTSWIRATYAYDDVADSISGAAKAAKGALQPFDALNNLTTQESAGSGGASSGDMFETLPVEGKYNDWANWLKDMWDNADFYDLGKLLGEKLKGALDSIPWDGIKEGARKIGKSLATLINGFVEVEGLGLSIGKTIAEAINTGFEFLNSFVNEIHGDSVGKFIADIINGSLGYLDWPLIYDTFTTAAQKISDGINAFVGELDPEIISGTISNFFNTITDSIYIFITETDWEEHGAKLGEIISDAWAGIDWGKAGETVGEAFKAFFGFISSTIENINWWEVGESVKDFLVGIDWAGVAESFFEAVGAALGGLAAFLGGLLANAVADAVDYFRDKIEEAGGNVVEGILVGIAEALVNVGNWVKEHIFQPFIEGFQKAFEIHSPSKVMEEMGGYIISGLLNGLKSTWDTVVSWIEEKIQWLLDKVRSVLSAFGDIKNAAKGITTGSLGSAIGGILNAGQASYNVGPVLESYSVAYPAFENTYSVNPMLTNPSANDVFPAYANGQVIPRTMEPHLAWLGDNTRETEVVSPLSTIEKAVENAINRIGKAQGGSVGNDGDSGDIVINIDGEEVFRVTRKWAQDFKRRTGKTAF